VLQHNRENFQRVWTWMMISDVRIVILFKYGRLGNQLFQLAACGALSANARVACIDLDAMGIRFECESLIDMQGSLIARLSKRILRKLGRWRTLRLFRILRLFPIITESEDGFTVSRGLLSWVAILDGFFSARVYS